MGRNSGGYTIIEVMIVLAITGILFASAILVFGGQQGSVSFSQTMRGLSSKIQNYSSEISAGNYAGSSDYSCTVDASGNPSLSKPGGSSDSGCVFLGRVMQVTPGQSTLKTFTVIGSRDVYNGGDTLQPATDINDTHATLATLTVAGVKQAQMEEDYDLENGAVFVSSKDPTNNEQELAGIYSNLQGGANASSSANSSLLMKLYQCNSPGCTTINDMNSCLAATSGGCGTAATTASVWKVCVKGSNGKTAAMEVDSTSSGISTKVTFLGCS